MQNFPRRSECSWDHWFCLCVLQDCCICSHCQVVSWWGVLCNSWEGIWFMWTLCKTTQFWKVFVILKSVMMFVYVHVHACVCIHRMTVYSKCGIPPRAGVLQWWSRTSLIKSLLLFTSPSFTWPILALLLVCPGGRPASSCPSKKHTRSHSLGAKYQVYSDMLSHMLVVLTWHEIFFCSEKSFCHFLSPLLKEKFVFLHIKPNTKDISDHIRCSTTLLRRTVQSPELRFRGVSSASIIWQTLVLKDKTIVCVVWNGCFSFLGKQTNNHFKCFQLAVTSTMSSSSCDGTIRHDIAVTHCVWL